MKKVTLFVGLTDKDTHFREIETVTAYKVVTRLVAETVGGGTVSTADGIYTHDDGTVVIEKSFRIEILDADESAVSALVADLKKLLNQESVLVQREKVETAFI